MKKMSKLYVKINNEIHICKNVDLKMKVKDFKKKLNIERLNIRKLIYGVLIFKGKILNEDMTLHSYGIKNEDTIVILFN